MNFTLEQIEKFLSLKRIALVGVSRNPKDFTRRLMQEFHNRGFEVVPVNPNIDQLGGEKCYPKADQIIPRAEGALLLTPPERTEEILLDSVRSGIYQVWILNKAAADLLSPETREICRQNGVSLIGGVCPYLFLPQSGFIHQLHGWILKLTGNFPKPVGTDV